MGHRTAASSLLRLAPFPLVLFAACGGGGTSPALGGFQLVSISAPEGAILPINQPIELVFNGDVDPASIVAGSTIQVRSIDGSGADAFYTIGFKRDAATGLEVRSTLIVQPFCPLLDDLSDAGFQPGGVHYQLFVPGETSGAPFTIQSELGESLEIAQTRSFFTPDSTEPGEVFFDPVVGGPDFVAAETFVRLGNGDEIPFVFTGSSHELPQALPLNLYSDAASRVEFLVQLDQPVSPSAQNLDDDRVRLEFLAAGGSWQPLQTRVELEKNCPIDGPGALLRLTPEGILPQASELRVRLLASFEDLGGEKTGGQTDFFAPTETVAFASLAPPGDAADELLFDFVDDSLQDVDAVFDTPVADWKDGTLTSAFDFQGTGGPGGDFDWHVDANIQFSTDSAFISGGPDGVKTTEVPVVGGVVDVEDLWIKSSGSLRIVGSKPLTILATGEVRFDGTLNVSGLNAKKVGTLFTPNQPEVGAPGVASGGKGGDGSFLTSASTPSGGVGEGPFGIANAGGRGGDACYDGSTTVDLRRAAGGGGGRFGPDVTGGDVGLIAMPGADGHPLGTSGKTGMPPPNGGLPGPGPFLDGDPGNDFFGKRGVFVAGELVDIVPGELAIPWAGAGGGAGGDSVNASVFPTVPFALPYIDKKGAGAGGGGGQVRIIALGRIVFGPGGRIVCDGGIGNVGESASFGVMVGGSSGGGSGGHVILESATQIDFTDGGGDLVAEYVSARGGLGGPGKSPEGWSTGGNGGPGVIQLHVPEADPAQAVGFGPGAAIRLPASATDLSDVTAPAGVVLIPTFGARSKARSRWIPLGAAAELPTGGAGAVFFRFDGTDPDDQSTDAGKVAAPDGVVAELATLLPDPVLAPEFLGDAAPAPFVDADGFTLVLSKPSVQALIDAATGPSDDVYLRNPALLKSFALRLHGPAAERDFDVASATYDDGASVLRITVDPAGGSLEAFVLGQGGPAAVDYELRPRYFRVRTGVVRDSLPSTAFVRVLFQAATAGPDGLPDEDDPVVDWTADPTAFNAVPPGVLSFFRVEVEFDLDPPAGGAGLTVDTEPVSLEFLRLPFRF